MNLTSTSVT